MIRRRFEARFSVERMARDYLRLYGELTARGAAEPVVRVRATDEPARDAV